MIMDGDDILASRLLDARQRKGLTQQQVADAVGVAPALIVEWEGGGDGQLLDKLPGLSEVLGVPLDQLIDREARSHRWLDQNQGALADANVFVDRHGLWSDGKRLF
jgi:transcriptional regulator with XRE-family HTH domain